MSDLTDPGYGDVAVRVEVALLLTTVAFVEPRSTLEADMVGGAEGEPRGSLPCAAWKRETVVFVAVDPFALGVACSSAAGVSGGDMNATFLCWSVAVVVSMLPFCVLRDGVRTMVSGSVRCEGVRVAMLKVAVLSCDRTDGSAALEVLLVVGLTETGGCDVSSEYAVGWLTAMSGSGLNDEMEVGVDVTRVD